MSELSIEDLVSRMYLGREFQANGKTWLMISVVNSKLVLAVEKDTPMPAPIMLVEFQPTEEIKTDKIPE